MNYADSGDKEGFMVIVKIHDKRNHNGYRIKFFHSDDITQEIADFVANTPKAYWVESCNETYTNRDKFLETFQHQ